MKWIALLFLILSQNCLAQSYEQDIKTFRNNYVAAHLVEAHSPIKYEQVKDLRFFPIDKKYQIAAKVTRIDDKKGFTMLTHSGKKKHYYKYARLSFSLKNKTQHLYLYQSKSLMKNVEYKDYLFLPFTDNTNYETTFGGGRYLDFVLTDVKNGTIEIDFNKSYNPYCAYAGGFNCPIPPKENDLKIKIKAGEKSPANINIEH